VLTPVVPTDDSNANTKQNLIVEVTTPKGNYSTATLSVTNDLSVPVTE